MERANKFLDLYKQIEDALEQKYRYSRRKFSSVVYEYIKDGESEPIRDKLNVCREIRNVLTHNANIGGEPIIQPSTPVISSMYEILDYINKPPLAISYAVLGENIIKCKPSQKVLRVMEIMYKNGYSHVPVIKDGSFVGVFSTSSVFMYVLNGSKSINKETTIEDLVNHIILNGNDGHYSFLPKDATYIEAKKIFESVKGKNKRISVIFITETGNMGESILGMLVPWDILGKPKNK